MFVFESINFDAKIFIEKKNNSKFGEHFISETQLSLSNMSTRAQPHAHTLYCCLNETMHMHYAQIIRADAYYLFIFSLLLLHGYLLPPINFSQLFLGRFGAKERLLLLLCCGNIFRLGIREPQLENSHLYENVNRTVICDTVTSARPQSRAQYGNEVYGVRALIGIEAPNDGVSVLIYQSIVNWFALATQHRTLNYIRTWSTFVGHCGSPESIKRTIHGAFAAHHRYFVTECAV